MSKKILMLLFLMLVLISVSAVSAVDVDDTIVSSADADALAVYDDETDELIATFANAASGKPVINAHVNIKIDGVNYAAITDANGQAKVSTASLTPGDYTADISYKGNARYNPSSTTYDFKVEALLK